MPAVRRSSWERSCQTVSASARGESFEKEGQGLIDAYLQAKTPQAEAKALAALADALQTKWGWSRADYLDVVRAAKSNGLAIYGIDEREGPFSGRTGKAPEDNQRDIAWRNQYWARAIDGVMKDQCGPQDKFVVLGGSGHGERELADPDNYDANPADGKAPSYGVDYALDVPFVKAGESPTTSARRCNRASTRRPVRLTVPARRTTTSSTTSPGVFLRGIGCTYRWPSDRPDRRRRSAPLTR
jgi:hypothetical protein